MIHCLLFSPPAYYLENPGHLSLPLITGPKQSPAGCPSGSSDRVWGITRFTKWDGGLDSSFIPTMHLISIGLHSPLWATGAPGCWCWFWLEASSSSQPLCKQVCLTRSGANCLLRSPLASHYLVSEPLLLLALNSSVYTFCSVRYQSVDSHRPTNCWMPFPTRLPFYYLGWHWKPVPNSGALKWDSGMEG